MSAVESLSPVCVDIEREAPETPKVAGPRAAITTASKSDALRREERWTFAIIAVFAAMLAAVAAQPASARHSARREVGAYAQMDAGVVLVATTR